MDTRLLLISHASTAAMRAGRFPADDPLDTRGLTEAAVTRARLSIPDAAAVFVSPAVCARDTATALGLEDAALGQRVSVDAGLADMDYGLWHGRRLADLAVEASEDLAAWTQNPDAAAHGGESFSQLVKRVGQWLDALDNTLSERSADLMGDVLSEGMSDSASRALSDSVAGGATDHGASSNGTNESKARVAGEKNGRLSRNARNVVAITHAQVIRAAIVHTLGASPAVFPRIEIAPLSMIELRHSRRGWTWWPASQ
ncbi:histidine phosphatase family protein [Paraburkholderia caffeinilytica]|uniref:histidine phosphatase family protein n=1 Tax=Paraburkholderia caffeinilytica TaxID=1761016 RepID=UPI0038BA062D